MRIDERGLGVVAAVLLACQPSTPASTTASSSGAATTDGTGGTETTAGTIGSTDAPGTTQGTTGAPTTGGPTGGPTTGSSTSAPETTGGPAGEELLIADFFGDAVVRLDAATGAQLAKWTQMPELDGALGMVISPEGHVLVASEEANSVLRFAADGTFIDVFVADDPGTPEDETGGLSGPGALLFAPDGALLVSSFDSDAILRYDGTTGAFIDVFVDTGEGGLNGPDAGMVFGPDEHLYVPSYYTDEVLRYDGVTGEPMGAFTPADGSLSKPRTLVFTAEHLLVTSEGSGEVVRFDASTGAFVDVLVPAASGLLTEPSGMAQLADGTLLVVSIGDKSVEAFDVNTGEHLGQRVGAAGGLQAPTHMIVRAAP